MRALKLLQFNENRHLELMNQRFIIQKENLEKQFEQDLRVSPHCNVNDDFMLCNNNIFI